MEKEKRDFLLYQWLFFVPFSVLAMLGALIVSVFALFIFITTARYALTIYLNPNSIIFYVFVMVLIAFIVVAALVYSVVMIIKKYIKAVKDFRLERQKIFDSKSSQSSEENKQDKSE